MKKWTLNEARKACPGWEITAFGRGPFRCYAKDGRGAWLFSRLFDQKSAALAEIVEVVRRQDVDKTPAVIRAEGAAGH